MDFINYVQENFGDIESKIDKISVSDWSKYDILQQRYSTSPVAKESQGKIDVLFNKRGRSNTEREREEFKEKLFQNLSKWIEKNNTKGSNANEILNIKKKIFDPTKNELGVPISIFHYKNYAARQIPKYRQTVQKMSLLRPTRISKLLNVYNVVDYFTYRMIGKFTTSGNINPEILKEFYGFIYSEEIAIPFFILNSDYMDEEEKIDVTIVCHDFFDHFIEYIGIYRKVVQNQKNKRIILFNYPGQAYTIFPTDIIPTNQLCADVLDALIYRLDRSGVISIQKDKFNFIGYGFGGNILLHLLVSTDNAISSYSNLMLVNSFSYIDELLLKTVNEMIDIFKEAPAHITELPFEFYSFLVHSKKQKPQQIKEQIAQNPITMEGRLCILNGCLNSLNVRRKIPSLQINMSLVHSLNNCFVDISHVDVITNMLDERFGVRKNAIVEVTFKKKTHFIEGGHAVLRESLDHFMSILSDFINEDKL